jgi:hypothetical protein
VTGQIDTYVRVHRLDDAGRAALFTEARTANAFTDTPVPDRTLRAIWQSARLWPYAPELIAGQLETVLHLPRGQRARRRARTPA